MEDIDLDQKQNYVYSLLDEVRNAVAGLDEIEFEKFASVEGSNAIIDALDSVEWLLTDLVTGLKAE